MQRKIITVKTVKELAKKGANGQKRYSLYEDRMNHAVFTENPNHTLPKEGEKVLVMEQEVTTTDGQVVKGWYYVAPFTQQLVKAEAARDFDAQVATQQKINGAVLTQRLANLTVGEISAMLEI